MAISAAVVLDRKESLLQKMRRSRRNNGIGVHVVAIVGFVVIIQETAGTDGSSL